MPPNQPEVCCWFVAGVTILETMLCQGKLLATQRGFVEYDADETRQPIALINHEL
jgi:hypothetical protein